MKYLVVYAHPNPASFNHAILETVVGELEKAGQEVVVRDLYGISFNPLLSGRDFAAMQGGSVTDDVRKEQEYIRSSDLLIVIFPLWWAGMPAMLKGYIDRVFTDGFAYSIKEDGIEGLLKGKKIHIITTTGAPREMYEEMGMFKSLSQTIDGGIFQFCGMELTEHTYFTAIPYIADADRKQMLEELKGFVKGRLL